MNWNSSQMLSKGICIYIYIYKHKTMNIYIYIVDFFLADGMSKPLTNFQTT